MKWLWKKDGRGKNPNSLATLAQLNAERRAARRAALGEDPSSPPPATPTPPPHRAPAVSSAQEFFSNMIQYENWRTQVYNTEQARRDQIAAQIREQIRHEVESQGEDAPDPVVSKAMEFILSKVADRATGTAQGAPASTATPGAADLANVPASQPHGVRLSQEQADAIADQIEDAYPALCRQARTGELSQARAMGLLTSRGLTVEDASMVYQSIMAVDDDAPPEGV